MSHLTEKSSDLQTQSVTVNQVVLSICANAGGVGKTTRIRTEGEE